MSGAPGGSTIRSRVMALPEDERLLCALDIIDALSGQTGRAILVLMQRFDLTRTEALVLSALNAAHPGGVSKEDLFVSIWGHDSDVEPRIVDIFICKLRAKIGQASIRTHWGHGFSLVERITIPAGPVSDDAIAALEGWRVWSAEEDAEMCRMMSSGSAMWAIADELGRSERACRVRWRALNRRVAA